MRMQYPLLYVLVSMNRTQVSAFNGLEPGVLLVPPLTGACTVEWETDMRDAETDIMGIDGTGNLSDY